MEATLLEQKQTRCGAWRALAMISSLIVDTRREMRSLGCIAGPMIFISLVDYVLELTCLVMVGKNLGKEAISCFALAASVTELGFGIIVGMGDSLESLCGKAYGARQYNRLSVHAYRGAILLLLMCIPISVMWDNLGTILGFIGIKERIAKETAKYAMCKIPALLALAASKPMQIFLQSQSISYPIMLSAVLTLCIHIPLSWIIIFKSGLGFVGAAVSISVSYWINSVMLSLYIIISRACAETRAPISKEAFRIWGVFKIAFPSAVMTCLEEWSFELLVILSGQLPNAELETSVISVCHSIIYCVSMISVGLGTSASVRISNELGGGKSEAARKVVRVVLFIAVTISIVLAILLLLLRGVLGYAYSSEKEVVAYVDRIAPLLCLSVIMECLQGPLSGVARGCGWQYIGAFVNFGAFCLLGIPIAVTLAFLWHLGATGLWTGLLCGSIVQSILLATVSSCTNWDKQVTAAREEAFEGNLPVTINCRNAM